MYLAAALCVKIAEEWLQAAQPGLPTLLYINMGFQIILMAWLMRSALQVRWPKPACCCNRHTNWVCPRH